MSTASVHGAAHPAQVPTSSASYAANPAYHSVRPGNYPPTSYMGDANGQQPPRQERSRNAFAAQNHSSEPRYYSNQNTDEYMRYAQADHGALDQYDGAPVPPPRTSSQQQGSPQPPTAPSTAPLDERVAASRQARHNTSNTQSPVGDYSGDYRERPREDTANAIYSASRSHHQGTASPNARDRSAGSRERGHHAAASPQARSTGGMTAPPLVREYSEVINRVVVSDPKVDAERMQERVAEAQPAPIGIEVGGLGLVPSEGVDNGGRGSARRQDYSKSSRRRDVQFGDYMLGQTLGEGEFGKVKLGWKKDGSSQVAIKLIRRETVATNPSRLPKIYREISILRDLAHPNIVRLHEMVETERHIGIILEYASGGELFDYILTHRYLKDPAARRLFAQLVSGVGYLHKKGIVHRDLKLENLLLDQNRNIIITDFGFANTFNPVDELSDEIEYNLVNKDFVRKFKLDRQDANGMRRGDLMQTSCGSPCYAAPELVVSDSLYTGRKVDVWSCGVILYAMLAGYLPFDDDPANPEGDNINLLYKYITTTPLTFPDYVSPHARDLLRRILVPDPRKRADLFEVARHSWLSEYHHVVSHVTSSTTNIADIANSTVLSDHAQETPKVQRSASVRAPSKPASQASPAVLAVRTPEAVADADRGSQGSHQAQSVRHTLQPEYVAPQTHTVRGGATNGVIAPAVTKPMHQEEISALPQRQEMSSKPLPQEPQAELTPAQRMPAPVRPARDVPRSASDMTGAFAISTSLPQPSAPRPSTQGSLISAGGIGGTRSDLRLPSRGSYGQPVAPALATTNAQGRVTQPNKPNRGYNISGPMPQQSQQTSIGQPMTQAMPSQSTNQTSSKPSHHRRTSTLSGLGERLFGRSNSVRKTGDDRQKTGKKYPPTSMKQPMASDAEQQQYQQAQPRLSSESKRSFLGLGKKKSTDLDSQIEKPARRFSLIPSSMSMKGLMGGNKEQNYEGQSPQMQEYNRPISRPLTGNDYGSHGFENGDGQYDLPQPSKVNNFSRPQTQQTSQTQYNKPAQATPSNDVYGSTGVYAPARQHSRGQSQPMAQLYPDGFNDQPRQSMQQGRQGKNVLTKNNRKFADGYDNEPGKHGGSSGAVKKVQDFFRRRGRARADSEYR